MVGLSPTMQFKTMTQMGAQPFFNMPFHMPEYSGAVAIVEILTPRLMGSNL
jgi:hypothetical protein